MAASGAPTSETTRRPPAASPIRGAPPGSRPPSGRSWACAPPGSTRPRSAAPAARPRSDSWPPVQSRGRTRMPSNADPGGRRAAPDPHAIRRPEPGQALRNHVLPSSGRIGAYANSTFWGVLAPRGARQSLPHGPCIEGRQQANGGFSYLSTTPRGPTPTTPPRRSWPCAAPACRAPDCIIWRAPRIYVHRSHRRTAGTPCSPTARPTASPPRGRSRHAAVRAEEQRRLAPGSAPGTRRRLVLLRAGKPPDPDVRHRPGAARDQRQALSVR